MANTRGRSAQVAADYTSCVTASASAAAPMTAVAIGGDDD
jgi:hypothetical protein